MNYKDIDGWFDFEDVYEEIVALYDNATFVEVGSWLGRSAAFMGDLIKKSGKNIKFYAVDTWQNGPVPDEVVAARLKALGGDAYETFMNNIRESGLDGVVNPLRMLSSEAATKFQDGSLEFVYIDASHDYESVKEDIRLWLPKIKLGGIIAGHDLGHDPVRRAVSEELPHALKYMKYGSNATWYHRNFHRVNS